MDQDIRSVWRPARVVDNRVVASGSMWITLEATDTVPAVYEPGHVLGVGVAVNGAHMRHAYTVSRADPVLRQFEHLYRIVSGGRMSPHLAQLSAGDALLFHGPFHTPIQHEIQSGAERIVLIATGTGVGPLYGYAEKALREGETRPMTLVAGFHEESDMCLTSELDVLMQRFQNFGWHYTVTRPTQNWRGPTGRVTDRVPDYIHKEELETSHFHLVGNGAMVHLVRKALYLAGALPSRVSIETYFNHHVEPSDAEIDRLAARFRE